MPKNGIWQKLAIGTLGLLTTICLGAYWALADDVGLNSTAREQMVGAEVTARLAVVEGKVAEVGDDLAILKVRQVYDRALMETIADAVNAKAVPTAPTPTDNTGG